MTRVPMVIAPRAASHVDEGFSLVEVLMATMLLTIGLVALAQLLASSTLVNMAARDSTAASMLAARKQEELRSVVWGVDASGVPVADVDTDTAAVPDGRGGTGMALSPPGALERDTAGYVDYVDIGGRKLGGGSGPPAVARFVRRWSIEPLPAAPQQSVIVRTLVLPLRYRSVPLADRVLPPGAAQLTTVRTRRLVW